MCECEVEYEYTAELSDELNLRVGDVITQVEKMEGGWWRGTLRGVTGMFPDNFVKVLPGTPTANVAGQPGDPAVGYGKKRCKVLFSYSPAHDDELSLEVDEVIDYICEVEDGWYKGRVNGRVGVFPSNFVEMCNTEDCDTIKNNHAAIVQEKNKKNSLQGSPMTNGAPAISTAGKLYDSANKENTSARLSSNTLSGSMTTPERMLFNTTPAPDTAPRLPPKPEAVTATPTLLPPADCDRHAPHSGRASVSVPISSNLFDPEDEPLGPMFGSLAFRIKDGYDARSEAGELDGRRKRPQRRASLLFGRTREERDGSDRRSSGGFFSRLRHSLGTSKTKLPFFSKSRLSVENIETQSTLEESPKIKRRSSFANFIKKCSISSNTAPKYDLKIERSEKASDSIASPDLNMTHSRSHKFARPSLGCLHSNLSHKSDFRDYVPTADDERDGMMVVEPSLSWIYQDMETNQSSQASNSLFLPGCASTTSKQGRVGHAQRRSQSYCAPVGEGAVGGNHSGFNVEGPLPSPVDGQLKPQFTEFNPLESRHPSGDSGVAWDSNLYNQTPSNRDMDSFFGSVGDLTDEMFNDIFQSPSSGVDESRSAHSSSQCDSKSMIPQTVPRGRSPIASPRPPLVNSKLRNVIRTNPYVNWVPPSLAGSKQNLMEDNRKNKEESVKKVQVTEI